MFGNFGATEILLVIGALVLLFGAKQIPKLAKGIGQSAREFRRAIADDEAENGKTENRETNRTPRRRLAETGAER